MKFVLAAALVACLAAPAFASILNGPQEHPLDKFLQVQAYNRLMPFAIYQKDSVTVLPPCFASRKTLKSDEATWARQGWICMHLFGIGFCLTQIHICLQADGSMKSFAVNINPAYR